MQSIFKSGFFWMLAAVPILAVLVVILYVREQNQCWERAWEECQAGLVAKGESVDWNDFVPPPLPPDQNFFAAPKMQAWFVKNRQTTNNELVRLLENPKSKMAITNPAEAAAYIVWTDKHEPEFSLIREALKRPHQRMDGAYSDPVQVPIPDFGALRAMSETLSQRARCHLLLQQPENALNDLILLWNITRIIEPSPGCRQVTMVAALEKVAIINQYLKAVSAGLEMHSWQPQQLTILKTQLAKTDLISTLSEAMSSERVCCCYKTENMWKTAGSMSNGRIILRGWLCENLVLIANWNEKQKESIDPQTYLLHPEQVDEVENEKAAIKHPTLGNKSALWGTPDYLRPFQMMAYNQTMANEAQIACALELYLHLEAYHAYPEKLDELKPNFIDKLPVDIVKGAALKYHRAPDGEFVLYSVGWNQKDDSGTMVKGKRFGDYSQGDWVWPMSE